MRSEEYERYIKSPEWRARRFQFIMGSGCVCERCKAVFTGVKGLEVHHKHYKTLGREQREDVEVLCSNCHPGADKDRARETENRVYNSRLDGWASKKYGEDWDYGDSQAIAEEFDEWLDRRAD